MSSENEALLLADALLGCAGPLLPILPAATCLRRQHAEIESLTAGRDALRAALKGLLARDQRNTCQHERTHRGGAIWEICDGCGLKWADDEGGKPEWVDPPEWDAARAAIDTVREAGK